MEIPDVSGKELRVAFEIMESPYEQLCVTLFLLAWRVQVAVVLGQMSSPDQIQALESMRFCAKQIFMASRPFVAALAVAKSLGFEAESLKGMNSEERRKYLKGIASELTTEEAPKGAKVLTAGQVNSSNIKSHRFGLMNQIRGTWQSKSMYAPLTVVKGMPASSMTLGDILSQAKVIWQGVFGPDVAEAIEIELGLFKQTLTSTLAFPQLFNDGVYISSTNLFAIEDGLGFQRPHPSTYSAIQIPEGDTDVILAAAADQVKGLAKATAPAKKAAPTPSAAPPPPPAASPKWAPQPARPKTTGSRSRGKGAAS